MIALLSCRLVPLELARISVPAEIVVAPLWVLAPAKVNDPPVALTVKDSVPEMTPVNEAENAPFTTKLALPTVEKLWIVLFPEFVTVPPVAMAVVPA